MDVSYVVWENEAAKIAGSRDPVISVAVPFFRVDVCPLAEVLVGQAARLSGSVELLFADDASGDPEHAKRLESLLSKASPACRLVSATQNVGRARIRNALHERCRGQYVLFLDSDMYPDSDDFLARYFELAVAAAGDVIVGGSSYHQIRGVPRSQRLYFYHSNRTQCVSVAVRRNHPLRYVFTNNLLLRRRLLSEIAFDPEYSGWGYEDTDWAFAVAQQNARVIHIDNTATHVGLIDDDRVIEKYKESVGNFVRLTSKFPAQSQTIPVYRLARRLSRLPLPFGQLAWLAELLSRSTVLPVRARYVCLQALKLWLYCGALSRHGGAHDGGHGRRSPTQQVSKPNQLK